MRKRVSEEEKKKKWKDNNKIRLQKLNENLKELKNSKGGKCSKCEETRLHLLDFHHLNPKEKIDEISDLLNFYGIKSWNLIVQEAEKCILLCSNCHKDFHHLERKTGIKIEEYLRVVG